MSIDSHARRLNKLEPEPPSEADVWRAAVYEIDRWQRAAVAMVAFAQALAGAPDPAPTICPPARDAEPPPSERPRHAPRPPPPPRRPAPYEIVTWEEAMRLPWLDGTPPLPCPPPTDEERRDPWHGWNLTMPPPELPDDEAPNAQ